MAKRAKRRKEEPKSLMQRLLGRPEGQPVAARPEEKDKPKPSEPKPSLETIGMSKCSVCGQEVSVMLTRTHHPFTACGRCGARTFYNSQVAIQILKRRLKRLKGD
jgi:DNA-directed RNA polymerase subunit RPC12/RpoP